MRPTGSCSRGSFVRRLGAATSSSPATARPDSRAFKGRVRQWQVTSPSNPDSSGRGRPPSRARITISTPFGRARGRAPGRPARRGGGRGSRGHAEEQVPEPGRVGVAEPAGLEAKEASPVPGGPIWVEGRRDAEAGAVVQDPQTAPAPRSGSSTGQEFSRCMDATGREVETGTAPRPSSTSVSVSNDGNGSCGGSTPSTSISMPNGSAEPRARLSMGANLNEPRFWRSLAGGGRPASADSAGVGTPVETQGGREDQRPRPGAVQPVPRPEGWRAATRGPRPAPVRSRPCSCRADGWPAAGRSGRGDWAPGAASRFRVSRARGRPSPGCSAPASPRAPRRGSCRPRRGR